jgi:hypothetical protein
MSFLIFNINMLNLCAHLGIELIVNPYFYELIVQFHILLYHEIIVKIIFLYFIFCILVYQNYNKNIN